MTTNITVTGSLFVDGIINMIGGAGTYVQFPQMTTLERNLMITGWTSLQQGRVWYNLTTDQLEMWDGNSVNIVG